MQKDLMNEKTYIQNLLNELGKAKEEVGKLKRCEEDFETYKKAKAIS